MQFNLTSPSFTHKGEIPTRFTCEGEDISPPLEWSGVPSGTESLALIVDDPDAPDPAAPRRTWVHWVIYNVPPDTQQLPENASVGRLPEGTRVGRNDARNHQYQGPCPPIGRHRYFFKLYALDVVLPDLGNAGKQELEQAMQGHVLGRAELIGTYQKR